MSQVVLNEDSQTNGFKAKNGQRKKEFVSLVVMISISRTDLEV